MTGFPARHVQVAHRLAQVTVVATLVLIVAGGLVTNTGAALAVPDWPTTFGHSMFLYPWAQMVGGVFFEHSHRLLGALVGMLTVALAGSLWPSRGALRALGLVAVAAVVTQGVLGGLRVVLLKDALAIVHGCLAQAFLGLLVVVACLTAPRRVASPASNGPPALRGLVLAATGLVYLQIVFGAFLTHAGYLSLHLVGALGVFALLPIVTARLRRSGDTGPRPVAGLLLGLLGLQLALGTGSYLARFSPIWIPGEQLTMLVLPVAHRLVGSLILAATVVLAVRVGLDAARTRVTGTSRVLASEAA
jgi:cytochrome c oxidase assembly protein subunit 15